MLDDRERLIVRQRLLAGEAASLAELGRQLGITRERVRQLETGIKDRLRSALVELTPLGADSAQARSDLLAS